MTKLQTADTLRQHHGILGTVTKTLFWRSFKNGSKSYVDAFMRQLPPRLQLHLKTPIRSITRLQPDDSVRGKSAVSIELMDGTRRTYDHVVLAVHANQALGLLGDDATTLEKTMLGCFETRKNVCYLHSDTSVSFLCLHLLLRTCISYIDPSSSCLSGHQRVLRGTATSTEVRLIATSLRRQLLQQRARGYLSRST